MELPTNSELHAILVHFPIALAIIGVPLVLLAALPATDRSSLRWISIGLYLIVAASAYAAFWSGERARDLIPNTYPNAVWDTLEIHEELATSVWIGALITAAFLAIGAFQYKWIRVPATTIAFVAGLVTAILVGTTGHFGGQLVYKHGVGTPGAAALYGAPAAVTPAPETETAGVPPVPKTVDSHFFEGMQNAATATPNTRQMTASLDAAAPEGAAGSIVEPSPEAVAQGTPAIRPIDMAEAAGVSYVRDVVPLMEMHCNECHNEDDSDGDLILTSMRGMLEGGRKSGPTIVPGDPDNSPLIQYIRGILRPQMPKKREPMTEDELHVLRMWIQAGAKDDSGSAAPGP